MVPFIVAGIAGVGVFALLGLVKKPKFVTVEFTPDPQPQPAVPAPVPAPDQGNPGVPPLDQDGFPQQATTQFLKDNSLQERRSPIVEQTRDAPAKPVAPAPNVFDANTGLNITPGVHEQTPTPSEPESFFDSINPFN